MHDPSSPSRPAGGPAAPAADHELDRFSARFREAVLACRQDNWRRGYEILTGLAQETHTKSRMPGVFYSYLGVAVGRCEGRRHDGMELARYGLRLQPQEPDNYANLALLCVTMGRRQEAVRWLDKGLRLAPRHRRLLELRSEMGLRGQPPLRFLERSNPLNVILGQVRHRCRQAVAEWRETKTEEAELERLEERARAYLERQGPITSSRP